LCTVTVICHRNSCHRNSAGRVSEKSVLYGDCHRNSP
jgi:hypothetical protein